MLQYARPSLASLAAVRAAQPARNYRWKPVEKSTEHEAFQVDPFLDIQLAPGEIHPALVAFYDDAARQLIAIRDAHKLPRNVLEQRARTLPAEHVCASAADTVFCLLNQAAAESDPFFVMAEVAYVLTDEERVHAEAIATASIRMQGVGYAALVAATDGAIALMHCEGVRLAREAVSLAALVAASGTIQ